jgi:hypothetical protein
MNAGEDVRRAQSKGLWPGVRSTFLRGLVGGAVCVGGGKRPEEGVDDGGPRFGRGEGRGGGAINPPTFPLLFKFIGLLGGRP